MTSINLRPLSFGATQQEIKNIKKACDDLSKKMNDEQSVTSIADTAEIGGKLFLTSEPAGNGISKLSVSYRKDADTFSSTFLNEGTAQENISFVKKAANQEKIASLLDKFKSILEGMEEREH